MTVFGWGWGSDDPPSIHDEMFSFHQRIAPGREIRKELSKLRDTNAEHLAVGLGRLVPRYRRLPRWPQNHWIQGSHATFTMVNTGSLDIDVAVVFDVDDIHSDPAQARLAVAEALELDDRNFSRPPERRTNAVTVWYANGRHVDLALYRRSDDGTLQHAGSRWRESDPRAFQRWFSQEVKRRSPRYEDNGVIRDGQLRRVVRLTKAFTKQYADGELPRGFPLTILVTRAYSPSDRGDDVALLETWDRLRRDLGSTRRLWNPVDSGEDLLRRQVDHDRVYRLEQVLDHLFENGPLAPLAERENLEWEEVLAAWRAVFPRLW